MRSFDRSIVISALLLSVGVLAGLKPVQAQTGPAGVGDSTSSVNASDSLSVWLRSDAGVTVVTGGDAQRSSFEVDLWRDQSGEGHDFDDGASPSDKKRQPQYESDALNGKPVLRFNTSNENKTDRLRNSESPVTKILEGDHTFFVVGAAREPLTGSDDFWAHWTFIDANNSENMGYPGASTGKLRIDANGTGPERDLSSPVTDYRVFSSVSNNSGLNNSGSGTEDLGIDGNVYETTPSSATDGAAALEIGKTGTLAELNIAEVVVYRKELNVAQRRLVENYLAEKYGLTMSNHDYYRFGDRHPNQIVGIGKALRSAGASPGGSYTRASSSVLTLREDTDNGNSLNDGEFVMAGHDGEDASGFATVERPNRDPNVRKTDREWRVEVTERATKTIDLEVDFSNLSLPGEYNDRAVYVDSDGDFTSGATRYDLDQKSGDTYAAPGVEISDGDYVTAAAVKRVVNVSQTANSVREDVDGSPDMEVQVTTNFPVESDTEINATTDGDIDDSGKIEDSGVTNADGANSNGDYEADGGGGSDRTTGSSCKECANDSDPPVEGDYNLRSSSVTISEGNTSASFALNVDNDDIGHPSDGPYEQTETFDVELAENGDSDGVREGSSDRFVGSIIDDDHPTRIAFSSDPNRTESNSSYNPTTLSEDTSGPPTFEVDLSGTNIGNSNPPTEATYQVTGGSATADSDFRITTGSEEGTREDATTGTVAIGNNGNAQFEVEILDDSDFETDETVTLELTGAQGGTIDGDAQTSLTFTIVEDDPKPTVSFESDLYTASEESDAELTVSLSEAAEVDVDLTITDQTGSGSDDATGGGTDYTFPDPAELTIPAGRTSGRFTLPVSDDDAKERNETIDVEISEATNASVPSDGSETSRYQIVDDDVIGSVGPGGVGNERKKIALWLKADGLGLTDGDRVNPWPDSSGSGNDATTVENNDFSKDLVGGPGVFVASGPNGQPAVDFEGTERGNQRFYNVDAPVMRSLPSAEHSLFGVSTIVTDGGNPDGLLETKTSDGDYRRSFGYQDDQTVRVSQYDEDNGSMVELTYNPNEGTLDGSYHLLSSEVDGGKFDLWYNGEEKASMTLSPAGAGTDPIIGYNRGTQRLLQGKITELIAYDESLNRAQRNIVHNYLSAKYDIPLDANDRYAGDESVNGDYDFGVLGIGRDGGSGIDFLHSRAKRGGITLDVGKFDDGEYLILGSQLEIPSTRAVNYQGTDGLPGLAARPNGAWFADVTKGAVTFGITFDLVELGFESRDREAGGYVLLEADASSCDSSNNDCSWNDAGGTVAVNGDEVTFSDVSLSSGNHYLSVGTTDQTDSPLLSRTALTIKGSPGSANTGALGADAGWRMIGPPVTGGTVGDITSDVRDPFVLLDLPSGNMLYQWDDANQRWSALASSESNFENTRGHLLFLFDDKAAPLDPSYTLDISRSRSVPEDTTVTELNQGTPGDGNDTYHVLANPYNEPFDLSSLVDRRGKSIGSGKTSFGTTVQIWDGGDSSGEDNATQGSYIDVTANGVNGETAMASNGGDVISPWQGFVVQRSEEGAGETQLTFRSAGRTDGERGIIGGKAETPDDTYSYAKVGLRMTVADSTGRQVARDEAASLLFHPNATTDWDPFDAPKLTPLSGQYAVIGPAGQARGDSVTVKAVESYPMPRDTTIEVPVRLRVEGGVSGTARIQGQAGDWKSIPSNWDVRLIDTKATADTSDDERVLLGPERGYTFDLKQSTSRSKHSSTERERGSPARGRRPVGIRTLPRSKGFSDLKTATRSAASSAKSDGVQSRFTLRVETSERNPMPVELSAMRAEVNNQTAVLSWETTSETNNAGFHVEHQRMSPGDTTATSTSGEWTRIAFVQGNGTTDKPQTYRFKTEALEFGRHAFRLRQVDTDGSESITEPVEATVRLQKSYALEGPYPNPVRTRATLPLTVRDRQSVTMELYDALGRRVRTVHRGELPSQETMRLTLSVQSLSSGTYFVRIQGEDFTATERLTVVR